MLTAITAVYVIVTYLLVREQRRQADTPEVIYEFEGDGPNADLAFWNVGSGAAVGLWVLLGPGDKVAAELPTLGERFTLLPGQRYRFCIGPPGGNYRFQPGDVSFVVTYLDQRGARLFIEVLALHFESADSGDAVSNLGSTMGIWTANDLRRWTRRSLSYRSRLSFQWRTRRANLTSLLNDDDVLEVLRQNVAEEADDLFAGGDRELQLRTRF